MVLVFGLLLIRKIVAERFVACANSGRWSECSAYLSECSFYYILPAVSGRLT